MTLLRECDVPGCSILTLGEVCLEHEQTAGQPWRRRLIGTVLHRQLPDHRYQLLASFASGLTTVVAIRLLRHLPPGQ